ncbi:DUF2442 domain-containing protein [uncultured Agitococcus sp.]|uniref:DUF2442 domain-containing protein n=1 Tax=uncultured Agitococcus sp. TaxID=1506599 RepID=UPI00263A2806|nr:DUF2442 domain-containing protein [uncultured Agitococcus sp.]
MTSKMQIAAVEVLAAYQIQITWHNGKQNTVDLGAYIQRFVVLQPLKKSSIFKQAQVGEWGFDVTWGNDIEIAASTLYRLALEQHGDIMPTVDFKNWMTTNKLSLTTAAQELGLSRRTITAYSSGAALIPKHIALACKGWNSLHQAA